MDAEAAAADAYAKGRYEEPTFKRGSGSTMKTLIYLRRGRVMARTEEERKAWWKRFYEKSREVNRKVDAQDAPLFGAQWSRWQGEEQDADLPKKED